jgi:hypothetical protein
MPDQLQGAFSLEGIPTPESVIPLEAGQAEARGVALDGQEYCSNADHPECPWCHALVIPLACDHPFRLCPSCGQPYQVWIEAVPFFVSQRYHYPEMEEAPPYAGGAPETGPGSARETLICGGATEGPLQD